MRLHDDLAHDSGPATGVVELVAVIAGELIALEVAFVRGHHVDRHRASVGVAIHLIVVRHVCWCK